MAMFGVLSFLPLFVQVVIGSSATGAGQVLTPMMLAMMVGSASGARIVLKVGFRVMCVSGFSLLAGGVFLLTRLGVGSDAPRRERRDDLHRLRHGLRDDVDDAVGAELGRAPAPRRRPPAS